ncbi:MAG: tyrosine--tRNA ligase [Candidatus Berkelbacteria bacterium]|nr:tyrosine--tRNA ligase [Candidatus Berkelbacteria bacterium]
MDQIDDVLTRGVSAIYPKPETLELALKSGKKLRVYNGIDPTGELHIGHMVVLRKLRKLQDLGHDIIVLIGDFTAQIGDPTDKTAARQKLTVQQIEENAKNYKELIGKILDTSAANLRFLHNQDWTNKLKPVDMLELASHFTFQQLIERDMFQDRIKNNKEIFLHEFLYPIFQAYDSVSMDVDMEIGGNDQIFNMLAGRTLMKKVKNKEKFVMAVKLLTDGVGKKMGKSEGNIISLSDSAENIFGKVMAYPDELILIGFELLTDKTMEEIDKLKQTLGKEVNPKDAKAELAYEIVKQLYSQEDARAAKENFENVFSKKKLPENLEVKEVKKGGLLIDAMVETGLVSSKNEARRLIEQGAVKINGDAINDVNYIYDLAGENILKVGKLRVLKIKS